MSLQAGRKVSAGAGIGSKVLAALGLVVLCLASGVLGGYVALTLEDHTPVQDVQYITQVQSTEAPDIPAIVEAVRRSVVSIEVSATVYQGPRPFVQTGAGTGWVLTSDGMIATNAHVITGADSIMVTLPNETVMKATVIGVDVANDLAVIHIDRVGLTPLAQGRSADLRVGDTVIAIGNALALTGGPTVTTGIVAALNRTITTEDNRVMAGLIQTDAAINEGDSGGPLANLDGEIVGINAIGTDAENVGFSIPIDQAIVILDRLMATGH